MNTTIDQKNKYIDWNGKTVMMLIIFVAIPIITGVISAFLTSNAMSAFNTMNKPALAPPAWLFPIAWTILYILMGVAGFLMFKSDDKASRIGLFIYAVQLFFNFTWSLIFFKFNAYVFAAVWLGVLLAMIIILIVNTAKYSKQAMLMLIPYAAWCCFAMYLNVGIAVLN